MCEARAVQRPVLRLVGFVTGLCVIGLLTTVFLPISADGLRSGIDGFGALAGPVFVVVSAVLALVFVPGPLLSLASGALFGTVWGFVWGLISSVLTAVLALLLARRAGRRAVEEISGERVQALIGLARKRGTFAVVVQRLLPGIPDAPLSYAFGLIGVRSHQIALGTLIGSAPRAFAYTALGSAAASGNRTLAIVAVGVGIGVSVVGVVLGALLTRRHRRAPDPGEEETTKS
jgi:uncharacterized membrane protein YdjX (TVP38/TMEM64 family)